MTSTLPAITRVLDARLYGVALAPLTLTYRVADPVAVGVALSSCRRRHTWHVARQALAAGLICGDGIVDYVEECAGAVLVSRLPGHDHVLMVLRSALGRWPLTVAAAHLAEFISLTHLLCPRGREQRLIDAELDAHIQLFDTTHGGGHSQ